MSLYWNESRYEPQNPEDEFWKGRNCCDTKYFSDLLGMMSERTRNLSPDGSQLNQCKLFCQIYSLIKWRYDCLMNLSNLLINLRSHQLGENRRNERHTQWVTCAVDYFHRFSLHIKWSTEGCICTGNRTQLSRILSVIILVINGKIKRPRSGSPNC